jgi:hypothetical protein
LLAGMSVSSKCANCFWLEEEVVAAQELLLELGEEKSSAACRDPCVADRARSALA